MGINYCFCFRHFCISFFKRFIFYPRQVINVNQVHRGEFFNAFFYIEWNGKVNYNHFSSGVEVFFQDNWSLCICSNKDCISGLQEVWQFLHRSNFQS